MAANTTTSIIPKLLAQALPIIQTNCVMPQLINRSFDRIAKGKGSTVDVPVPVAVASGAVSPSASNLDPAGLEYTTVPITMDQWRYAAFHLTDKDKKEVMDGVMPMEAKEAIKQLAKDVDSYLFGLYKGFYGAVGTAGTTPFASDIAAAVNARKILNEQEAPDDERYAVIDTTAEANALMLAAFRDTSQSSDNGPIIKGQLGTKLGFDWFYSVRVPSHTKGTAGALTVTHISNSAAGVKTVTLKVGSSTGTLLTGDIITFAGHTQQYVVTADATLTTSGVSVAIYPGLKVAVDGSGTPVAVTQVNNHVANLAFNRNAIAMASRPMEDTNEGGDGWASDTIVDPVTKILVRLQRQRQTFRTVYVFDILFGAAVIRREFGARILG